MMKLLEGRLYNKDGVLEEWYTNEAKEGFQQRADCMVEQYGSYSIMGSQVGLKRNMKEVNY